MTDILHLDEFQAYLLADDRSHVTISGYLGDVRLFAQWYGEHYGETWTPHDLTNEAVIGNKQHLLDQAANPKPLTAGWPPWRRTSIGWIRLDMSGTRAILCKG